LRKSALCLLCCLSLSPVWAAAEVPQQLLLEVVSSGSKDFLNRLLAHDVAINGKGAHGETALHLAARDGNLDLARRLVAAGAEIDVRDSLARTPLMLAAAGGHAKTAEMLLEKGADATAADAEGTTVLMWACAGDERDLVRTLLRKGAKLNTEDKAGRTAYDMVRYDMDKIPLADFFRDLGADGGSHTRAAGNLIQLKRQWVSRALAASEEKAGYPYGENLRVFDNRQAAGYYLMGSVLLVEGRDEAAAASLAEADKLEPGGCLPCQLPLAEVYASLGLGDRAVTLLQKLAARQPENENLTAQIFGSAEKIFASGNILLGAQLFQLVLERSPAFPAAHYFIGRSADENNLLDVAREHLSDYLAAAPSGEHAADAKQRMSQLSPTHVNVIGFDGKRLDTASLRGKHVLVDVWLDRGDGASLELLQKIAEDVDDLEMISVNAQTNLDEARRAAAPHNIPWRQFNDPGMRYFGDTYSIRQIPSIILVRPDGTVSLRVEGAEETSKRNLVRKVKKALR